MQMVILAGGLATRMRPLTETIPKSMLPINGKPFLTYQLDFVKNNDIKDVVLCVGHLSDSIIDFFRDGKRFGVNIKYSVEKDRLLGTAGALKDAENLLSDEFFVMYGDSYLFIDLNEVFKFFKTSYKLALMTIYENHDNFDKSNVSIEGNLIKEYCKNRTSKDMIYIDYGISLFNKKALELVPHNEPCSLEELFTQLITMRELLAFETTQRFYEIGSMKGLEEFRQFIQRRSYDNIKSAC